MAAILKKNPLNCRISATVRPILMKFGTMTHIGSWQYWLLKIQDNGGRHLENHKNRHIAATV